jgi:hypothetical protein
VSTLTSLARARAVSRGVAQPICTVRHVHVSSRPLVLIPLALAGEANAPLAAMVGDEPGAPQLLVVNQPRNRDQRFAFAAELADVVLAYIESFCVGAESGSAESGSADSGPGWDGSGRERSAETGERFAGAPQVWVPNPAGVGFVRLLGRSARFRRPSGDYAVDPLVPVLGRWLTFLAERAEHPGSGLLLAATDALALHWASGQSPVEDLNLAALLGWIDPPAGMTGAEAAARAEDPVISPPAGPATDPTFDNEVLESLVAACGRVSGAPGVVWGTGGDEDAGSAAAGSAAAGAWHRAEAALRAALAGQLAPTWRLMWRAVDLLRALPPGGRVAGRWQSDRDAFGGYVGYLRDDGPPQPRRDSAVAAARRLGWLERAQASYAAQRALDDSLVMAEYRLTGEAFAGPVTAAEPDRLDCTGRRRKLRPLITVATGDSLRVEPGAVLVSPARPGQSARVVSVTDRMAELPDLLAGLVDRLADLADGPPELAVVSDPANSLESANSEPADSTEAGLMERPEEKPAANSAGPPDSADLADGLAGGRWQVVLELSGGMGRALMPVPGSVPAVGERVCYTTLTDSYQVGGSFPAREDTPWTHGGPPPEYVPTHEDAAEEWS